MLRAKRRIDGQRFDLLAAFFTLLALLAALSWLRGEDRSSLWWVALCYALAVLSKESAYSFPLLLLFLILTSQTWGLRGWSIPSAAQLLGIAAISTALLLGIRYAIYNGMGGYPDATGGVSADLLSHGQRLVEHVIRAGHPVEQTKPFCLLGLDHAPGESNLGGRRRTDQPRQ